ncbi:MAG: hypothetical protein ABFD49_07360 [Armatimonadota bacterium]|nr:hypothetical protein [bacterium]
MRILHGIVLVIALISIIVGISQLFLREFWMTVVEASIKSTWLTTLFGGLGILFGGLLGTAAIKKAIAFRIFVLTLSVLMVIISIAVLCFPTFTKDLMRTMILNKSEGSQLIALRIGGLVRIVIGVILLFAVGRYRTTGVEQ